MRVNRIYGFITARKVSKYGVFSGQYFLVFSPNARKYGAEKAPYLDTFHVTHISINYDTLLQDATDIITKYDSYFIAKCNKGLLENATKVY